MAKKCVESIQPDIGRELCLVRGKNGTYLGYKKDILVENLSERDNTMFVCIRCQGIMRKVCLSSSGEQLCSCCKKKGEQTHPNLQMDNMILSFKCSCPLIARGCKWLGVLGGCQKHLDTCGYVYETCKLRCGVVLQRDEFSVHEMEKCPQRIVECEHCNNEFKSCELHTHLDKCPKMEVSCELKCGKIMCREDMTQHLKQECGLMLELCKLGCGKQMARNKLRTHVTDTCVQRRIQCEHCKGDIKFCFMSAHLDLCPKMEVSCELKCGVIMCREVMTQHLKQECGIILEMCKLGCGKQMTRDELRTHVTDTCVQRLIQCEHCKRDIKFCFMSAHLDLCPKMEVSCELKCGVVMCREVMTQHLKQECGIMLEMCKLGCGKEMTRDELRIHVTDTCVQRLIQCKHCKGDFKFCDMSAHLDVCSKMEVSCELKCGVVMCREVMTQHLEVDCPEKAIECPYAKYKCVELIKRKDMSKHLEERRMEHLELKLNDFIMESSKEFEIIAKQKEKISKQSATIGTMSQKITLQSATIEKVSQKITLLENEIQSLKKVMKNLNSIPIKLDWIAKLPGSLFFNHAKKFFLIAGYQFEFVFHRQSYSNLLQIRIYPQNGFYYEKLKWPFKAEFSTRLRSKPNPTVTKEFKSEMIVVERKDFISDSEKYFDIVSISSTEYAEIARDYLTDGVAEFEIYVIFINEAS